MRSIRFSLLLYFMGLSTLALVGGSLFLYHTAKNSLVEKARSTEELHEAQYRERTRQAEARFNDGLFFQAQTLARLTQIQTDWTRLHYRRLHALGLLSSSQVPTGYLLAPLWVAQSVRGKLSYEMARKDLAKVNLDETDLLRHLDSQVVEFFQIDTFWGSRYRSRSLGRLSFPDPRGFAPNEVFAWKFDTIYLKESAQRRIRLKVPATRILPYSTISRSMDRSKRGSRSFRPPTVRNYPPRPSIYIQCATDLRQHWAVLAEIERGRSSTLEELREESANSLASLRTKLLSTSVFIFVALLVGSSLLVRFGLAPVRRLSEAVGAVSAKDFRLPLAEKRMPNELEPIVERLEATLEMLRRAFSREKQATADISHELRTPLAALLTTTEVGLRKERSGAEYREMLEDCRLSGQQMHQIVERLLTLARLDAGVDLLNFRTFDVADLARQCVHAIRPLADSNNLKLHLHSTGERTISTDPDKLKEVLNNLLHNAIQYNRPGGSIDVSVLAAKQGVEILVQDTGIGIADESKGNIFERFHREDKARTGDGLHAGLGLAIVKEYVDLMQGSIELESVLGEGSTFRIQFPSHEDKPSGSTNSRSRS